MTSTERLAAVGELAAGLAHEVINPLDGVIECVRHLSADPEKSERAKRFLPLARDGLTRIERVMRQMLAFARAPGPAAVEPCHVGELVRGVAGLVEGRLAKRGVELKWDVTGDCSCLCDRQSVEQALLNLILNASDAVQDRPGARIRLRGECDDRWVRLSVEDNGPGVPRELRAKVFEPFFTTKEPERGTGLGLTVSRQNLRHCGGDIILDGSPSGGACFLMLLPKEIPGPNGCCLLTSSASVRANRPDGLQEGEV
jgi:C4-dicarboxylate-specific signal transduction histidine kinase